MTNVKRGLASIKDFRREQEERRERAQQTRADWFKFAKGTNTATVRFLQEIDEDSPSYSHDRGLALIAIEHQAPGQQGFKRRALCTREDEGSCYACERHYQDYTEGWKQRTNFYVNALVDQGEGLKVVVISRSFNSSFVQALVEEAVEEESITDANFKITRTGEGTTTQWLLKRLKGDPLDDSNVEVYDLDEVALRRISVEEQPKYFGAVYKEEDAEVPVSNNATDEW